MPQVTIIVLIMHAH